jgi:hypothetical protein
MRSFRLLHRRESVATCLEPEVAGLAHEAACAASGEVDATVDRSAYAAGFGTDDWRGSNAVFGLIGTSASANDATTRRGRAEAACGQDDLIAMLHAQYCRALDDPQALFAESEWAAQVTTSGSARHDPMDSPAEQCAPAADPESIEVLLSGRQRMEHVFGPFREGEVLALAETGPVPEILQLFAPTGYHAAASRRAAGLPPPLARREHHLLGIDSPFSMHGLSLYHDAQ